VLVTDGTRAQLRDYLTSRLEGGQPVLRLPVHRGHQVELSWCGSRVHIDDEVWPTEHEASSGRVWSQNGRVDLEVVMNPSALQVLVPRSPPAAHGHHMRRAVTGKWSDG
jgi:hypothetical protein